MDLKRAAYIAVSGYSSHNEWTLAEWFEARDLFRENQEEALQRIHIPNKAK